MTMQVCNLTYLSYNAYLWLKIPVEVFWVVGFKRSGKRKMIKFISAKLSGNILISLLIALVIFHVLVLIKVVPYEIVWAGQIKDSSSMFIYEGFAVFLTILFILIIWMKINNFKSGKYDKIVNVGVWIIFIYFLLNIVGNLASGVTAEKLIFTPITIIMTLLALRVLVGGN